jgi:hypothetical protein
MLKNRLKSLYKIILYKWILYKKMGIIKNKTCRLSDVAEAAELSLATVSQILNNKPCNYSSEETRQRVRWGAAERLP